jgi:hypothetical protein
MNSAGKEGNDPNVVPSSVRTKPNIRHERMVSAFAYSNFPLTNHLQALRKRGTPGSSSPAKRLAKRRQSMRNRRVSFAPDPELTMVHTFEKVSILGENGEDL